MNCLWTVSFLLLLLLLLINLARQDRIRWEKKKVSFLKCLVLMNINVVTARFIYNWLLNVRVCVCVCDCFLLPMGDQISGDECVCVCVMLLPACACAVWANECVSHLPRIRLCTVCTACLCRPCETGSFLASLVRLCVMTLCSSCQSARLQVYLRCTTVCWCMAPTGECVCMRCVWCVCVCVCRSDSRCGSVWCSARFDRRCCTKHSMYLFLVVDICFSLVSASDLSPV